MKTKMYSFDVYQLDIKAKKSKKVSTHSYPNIEQAKAARVAIQRMPYGMYFAQFRENGPFVKKTLGGYTCSEIKEIN